MTSVRDSSTSLRFALMCLALVLVADTAAATNEWRELPPPVRAGGGAVYDARDDRMLVVGPDAGRFWSLALDDSLAWREVPVSGAPEGSPYYRAAVLDSVRRRILVPCFRSTVLGYGRLELWGLSLDTRRWTQLPTGVAAFNRWAFSAVLDPVRDRLLIFGGFYRVSLSISDATNQVLSYDLANSTGWTEIATAGTAPVKRGYHTAIYDPRRDRMLVFGGQQFPSGYNFLVDETWQLALSSSTPTWTFLTPTSTPPWARMNHIAVYSRTEDRMVIYGGNDRDFQFNDIWSLPLDTPGIVSWVSHGEGPGARVSALAVHDWRRARMIVVGGVTTLTSSSSLTRYDLWSWVPYSPGTWTDLLGSADQIRNRADHSALLHPQRNEMVVLFGSGYGETFGYSGHSDAWAYGLESCRWRRLGALNRIVRSHVAVHDSPRDRIVAFLGCCTEPLHALNPATGAWTSLAAAGTAPPAEYGFAGGYDPVAQRLLVFGGTSPGPRTFTTWYDNIWSLDLSGTPTWSELSTAGSRPGAREGAWMIYDAPRRRMLVFGGHDSASTRKDLWALTLEGTPTWSSLPTSNPPPGTVTSVVLDSLRNRLVAVCLLSGSGSDERLGVWTLPLVGSGTWMELEVQAPPPRARIRQSVIYDPARDRLVMFGGWDFYDHTNDVWAVSFDTATPAALHLVGWQLHGSSVALTWYSPTPGLAATVHRRMGEGEWRARGVVTARSDGRIEWLDEAPPPGVRVRYRLGVLGDGGESFFGEVEILSPSHPRLALRDVRPNPTSAALRIGFTLAPGTPARLALLDVAGRCVLERSLGDGPAGELVLAHDALPAPGLYFLRLEQSDSAVTRRIVIAR